MDIKANVNLYTKPGNLKGIASIIVDDSLVIKGLKVWNSEKGLFVAMPSQKVGSEYKDVCFATTDELRQQIGETVLNAYEEAMEQVSEKKEQKNEQDTNTKESKKQTGKRTQKADADSQKQENDISEDGQEGQIDEGPVMSM